MRPLILVGVCAASSSLVGVGGGSVIVPVWSWPSARNLIARGTSLLVAVPTIAGTVTNLRHRMVDLRVSLIVGASAAATGPAGPPRRHARLPERRRDPLQHLPALTTIASTILKMRRKARTETERFLAGTDVRVSSTVVGVSDSVRRQRPSSAIVRQRSIETTRQPVNRSANPLNRTLTLEMGVGGALPAGRWVSV